MKVLIVDDSALMRRKLAQIFEKESGFELIFARNGAEAIEANRTDAPDVVTLDINMPEMDGLTALSQIMLERPVPVVMISSLTETGALATFEALALGAVDYVTKPDGTISLSIDEVEREIIRKVRQAARAKLDAAPARQFKEANFKTQKAAKPEAPAPVAPSPNLSPEDYDRLILIGVSTGGPRTLEILLSELPADFPFPIIVAQHMPAAFTGPFASRLNGMCALRVEEVTGLTHVLAGRIYIAKGAADAVITERNGKLYVQPKPENKQFLWHPSVELLARSALEHCNAQHLIGIMLTGMGNDGTPAFCEIHAQGGKTIAESEESAVLYGMPKELIEANGASLVLPIHKIARQLMSWVK